MNKVEIKLSKKKMIFLLIGCVLFVTCSIFMITNPEKFVSILFRNEVLITVFGAAGAIFFGVCSFMIGKRIPSQQVGLIIDEYGITDNSSAASVGFIKWDDISELRRTNVMSTEFLLIDVTNPDKYITNSENRFKAKLQHYNQQKYGTPISISPNALKCNIDELENLIKVNLLEYRNKFHL